MLGNFKLLLKFFWPCLVLLHLIQMISIVKNITLNHNFKELAAKVLEFRMGSEFTFWKHLMVKIWTYLKILELIIQYPIFMIVKTSKLLRMKLKNGLNMMIITKSKYVYQNNYFYGRYSLWFGRFSQNHRCMNSINKILFGLYTVKNLVKNFKKML